MTRGMPERGLDTQALASTRPHGDRIRYVAGCRCDECRRANTLYERTRAAARAAGDFNGLVLAQRAREHIAALSAAGVGRRQVVDASGVADTIVQTIISGAKLKIRARTERAILTVTRDAIADHALIDAGPTWKLLDELLGWGYAKAHLARELGYGTPALQIKRTQCTVRTAYDVQRLHARLRMVPSGPTLRLIGKLREEGYRQARIEAMLADLAARDGAAAPDLVGGATGGEFLLASVADLVKRLYAEIMELENA